MHSPVFVDVADKDPDIFFIRVYGRTNFEEVVVDVVVRITAGEVQFEFSGRYAFDARYVEASVVAGAIEFDAGVANHDAAFAGERLVVLVEAFADVSYVPIFSIAMMFARRDVLIIVVILSRSLHAEK